MHEVLSLKEDAGVHDMWVLCHACLESDLKYRTELEFFFSYWGKASSHCTCFAEGAEKRFITCNSNAETLKTLF